MHPRHPRPPVLPASAPGRADTDVQCHPEHALAVPDFKDNSMGTDADAYPRLRFPLLGTREHQSSSVLFLRGIHGSDGGEKNTGRAKPDSPTAGM